MSYRAEKYTNVGRRILIPTVTSDHLGVWLATRPHLQRILWPSRKADETDGDVTLISRKEKWVILMKRWGKSDKTLASV
jgi:hypothetical protein